MRQFFLFIFLVLLIFNGRSQSSSLDSLRLVYPTWVGEYINIKISQDGNWLATTNNKSKLLTLWNLKNRKMVYTYRFEGSVDDLDFDKEEKLNLTTYHRSVRAFFLSFLFVFPA